MATTKKKPVDKDAKEFNWRTPDNGKTPAANLANYIRGYCDGRIALDPCTDLGNHLGALYCYTVREDGLAQDWSPTEEQRAKCVEHGIPWVVYVNPPYGKYIHGWLAKIKEQAGRGVQMLVLLSATRYEQQYFTDTLNLASSVCYIRGRVPFVDPKDGKAKSANRHANKLWGFNVDLSRFDAAFRELGPCYAHMPIPSPNRTIEPIALPDQTTCPHSTWLTFSEDRPAECLRCGVVEDTDPLPDIDPFCDGEREIYEKVRCGVCEAELVDGACPAGHDHASATRRRLPIVVSSSGPPGIPDLEAWTRDALERIDGRRVVVSVSGGKDSTAVCLLLKEARIAYDCIHMDTGWEHALTVDYVRNTLPDVIGPIEILRSHLGGMEELVKKRGMFPSRVRRFCTQELKVRPFKRYLRALQKAGEDPINAVGIRRAESRARSKLEEWEEHKDYDCLVWCPIIHWSTDDVIEMHHRHGIAPNPLYLKGATRVGCWPCIFARKKEIRMIADLDPERIATMRRLEGEVAELARERYAEKGETFESLGYRPPTWFQNPTSRTNKATGKRAGDTWPIDDVVSWARTKRGGKVEELLAPGYAEEGCLRWGMCELVDPETEAENAARMDAVQAVLGTAAAVSDPALEGFV